MSGDYCQYAKTAGARPLSGKVGREGLAGQETPFITGLCLDLPFLPYPPLLPYFW